MVAAARNVQRSRSPALTLTISVLFACFLAAVWFAVPRYEAPAVPETGSVSATLVQHNKIAVAEPEVKINEQLLNDEEGEEIKGGAESEESKEAEGAAEAELTVENTEAEGGLITQAKESVEERQVSSNEAEESEQGEELKEEASYNWKLCENTAGADYIPCLDNVQALKKLKSTKHYEHRERHCPSDDDSRLCLVPLPEGYKVPIQWPRSRDEVWYGNVPHTGLVSYKADQRWVVRKEDVLIFPGSGTQFKKGAGRYIDFVEKTLPAIAWGKHTRVILDVGCGVASFGGYLFEKDVLTMSFAPKDEHEAQVQFALERGIPAFSAVMGTTRLPFPSNVFDAVHCARCRVPWHIEGAKLLVELNRLLRPGGYFIWSATPVYQREPEDVQIWKDTTAAASQMCWKRLARVRDPVTGIGVAIFQKPVTNDCYEQRSKNEPPLCEESDSGDSAWYDPLGACMHTIGEARATWPQAWPSRLEAAPSQLISSSQEFKADTEHWKDVVHKTYEKKLGINWDSVRNVMDMRAGYGGFAAALASLPVWVMNVMPVTEPDTLPVIFHRGLFGMYHDWCESFSTYPRTYDLLHADGLLSRTGERCNATHVAAEMDRILRPQGWAIIRDKPETLREATAIFKSLNWEVSPGEGFIAAQKKMWRPEASI